MKLKRSEGIKPKTKGWPGQSVQKDKLSLVRDATT